MEKAAVKNGVILGVGALCAWVFARWALPVLLPFALGGGLALGAEPMVRRLSRRMPRGAATGLGVTLVLLLLLSLTVLAVAFLMREAGRLTAALPGLTDAARRTMDSAEGWFLTLASRVPEGLRAVAVTSVRSLFSDGSALMERVMTGALNVAGNLLGGIPNGFLGLGTGILSAYMISFRLPALGQWVSARLPESWRRRGLPALKGMKGALWAWLSAQLKLMAMTFGLLTAGFFLLRVGRPVLWAAVIALVDAVPVLGTGMILVPWGVISLLRGSRARGMGLLSLFAVAWLLRSVMEPKLLGRELGLDPLVTLIAMYAGYRFFGFWGLLLAPVAAVAVLKLTQNLTSPQE